MAERGGPFSQGWGTFLRNHAPHIAAMDLFVVPTLGFKLLYVLVIIRLARRELFLRPLSRRRPAPDATRAGVLAAGRSSSAAKQIPNRGDWFQKGKLPPQRGKGGAGGWVMPARFANSGCGGWFRTTPCPAGTKYTQGVAEAYRAHTEAL